MTGLVPLKKKSAAASGRPLPLSEDTPGPGSYSNDFGSSFFFKPKPPPQSSPRKKSEARIKRQGTATTGPGPSDYAPMMNSTAGASFMANRMPTYLKSTGKPLSGPMRGRPLPGHPKEDTIQRHQFDTEVLIGPGTYNPKVSTFGTGPCFTLKGRLNTDSPKKVLPGPGEYKADLVTSMAEVSLKSSRKSTQPIPGEKPEPAVIRTQRKEPGPADYVAVTPRTCRNAKWSRGSTHRQSTGKFEIGVTIPGPGHYNDPPPPPVRGGKFVGGV
eukprot:TRINITY_DN113167_c0_g1_i1.p1 TRINITY_DN113167_c0_g1~~TRINITY_DN113167_c0_g1_i1.p1  ORF type:complete len:271 (+),score=2.14 TRINITY_DN113167_c0_g1_i1:77-889(+)